MRKREKNLRIEIYSRYGIEAVNHLKLATLQSRVYLEKHLWQHLKIMTLSVSAVKILLQGCMNGFEENISLY